MKILFVCTGNTCRSPMAEAFAKKEAAKRGLDFSAESAGISTCDGLPASKNAVSALKKEGIDLSKFRSACLSEEKIKSSDIILTMTEEQCLLLRQLFPNSEIYTLCGRDVSDPFGGDEITYEKCAKEIEKAVVAVFDKLENENSERDGKRY